MGDGHGPAFSNPPANANPSKADSGVPWVNGHTTGSAYTVPGFGGKYTDGGISTIDPPTLAVVGNGGPGAPVQVNTVALTTYAANLRTLSATLVTLQTKLRAVVNAGINPGYFFEAYDLINRSDATTQSGAAGTTGGLLPVTLDFVSKLIKALNDTADALDQLAKKYTTVDQLNAATGKDLASLMATAESAITTVSGAPPVPSAGTK